MSLKGEPPLVSLDGTILDSLRVILPLVVTVGRSDPSQQPEANSVTFDWLGDVDLLALDKQCEVYYDSAQGGLWGDPPGGYTGPGGDVWSDLWSPTDPDNPSGTRQRMTRFLGRITDLDAGLADDTVTTKVTAVGRKADLGNVLIGDVPWPQETEAARVTRINALLGANSVVNDGSTLTVNPRDVDRQTALEVLEALCASTAAVLVERQTGQVAFEGYQTRAAGKPEVTLTEFQVLDGVGWALSKSRLVQQVTVVYGPRPTDGTERTTVYTAGTGRLAQRIDSDLTLLADAQVLAGQVLAHWGVPTNWDAPQIVVPVWLLPASQWDALMALTVGDLLSTTDLASDPDVPSGQVGRWFIEGWQESWERPEGGGDLEHSTQYAVSDFARWRSDVGVATAVAAVVDQPSAGYGTPRVVTATVTRTDTHAAVTVGTVSVSQGGTTLAGPVTVDGTGHAVLTVPGDALAVGTYDLTVHYAGRPGLTLDSSTTVRITVSQVSATSIVLSMPASANEQSVVTMTATVTPTAATGAVQFQYSTNAGSTWGNFGAPVSLVSGKASTTWTASNPSSAWLWRAVYQPNDANWAAATSAAVPIDVKAKTTRTLTYAMTWLGCYQGDGDKRTDTSEAYQGYYSSTNGNQRSLFGFAAALGTDWSGWTVTKVEVYLYYDHWYSNGGGTAIIGSHVSASEPASYPSGVVSNRSAVSWEIGQGKWVDITAWGKGLATNALQGIAIGPGPSTSSAYYGSATTCSVRITGYRYA